MKLQNLLLTILLFTSTLCCGQEITENKTDEFTGVNVKQTSFEILHQGFDFSFKCRFKKLDTNIIVQAAIYISGSVFSIEKNAYLMLKLSNGKIIKLKSANYAITERGGAANGSFMGSNAMGLTANFYLCTQDASEILRDGIEKLRFYTTDGYYEHDVKSRQSETFIKGLQLVLTK